MSTTANFTENPMITIEPDDASDDYLRPASEKSTDEELFLDSQETSPLVSVSLENLFDEEAESRSNRSTEQFLSAATSRTDDQEMFVARGSEFLSIYRQDKTPSSIGTFYIPDDAEINDIDTSAPQTERENQYLQELFGADPPLPPSVDDFSSREETQTTLSVSELSNCGYEIHQIQLLKPAEKTPIGFKLTKQADSLQYTMTAITEGSPADQAGLKVDDWLIQIEEKDIRLTDLHAVLKDICRLFLEKDSIGMVVARKRADPPQAEEQQSPNLELLSRVGLSNPVHTQEVDSSALKRTTDSNPDKFHSITVKDSSGLYFNSVVLDDNEQTQVHYVSRIQPISAAYRAGLRNYDRILTVNSVDVTKTSPEDLQLMIRKSRPLYLIIVRDPEYFKTIEDVKQNQIRKTLLASTYETVVYQQFKDLNYVLFSDDEGPLYVKYCVVKKEAAFDALGFRLNFENNVHIIRNIEKDFPGYRCGLRDNDIILFLNKRNVQQMAHEDLKRRLRPFVSSGTTFDLIALNECDLPRYRDYQSKRFIDWFQLFARIERNTTEEKPSLGEEQQAPPTPDASSGSSLLSGARICLLETVPGRSLGFTVEGGHPPPYRVSKVQPDSPAGKAGLQLNDVILSINGASMLEKNYEETLQIIRNALQQKTVQFVVNQAAQSRKYHSDRDSDLSYSSSGEEDDEGEEDGRDPREQEAAHRGAHAVQIYQRQRSKELSYAVRHCHISATTPDGAPVPSFGFELSEDPECQYPVISSVHPKSPGERSGLQTDDVLIKVNNRKTKGANFERVKKVIDKALPDGRIEMLVIDKEAFQYCLRTNRKFKEPYIKVRHIFPRSRSSVNYQSLPLIAARTASISQDTLDPAGNIISVVNSQYLPSQSEHDEDHLKASEADEATEFDLPSLTNTIDTVSHAFPQDKTKEISATYLKSPSQSPSGNDDSILDFVLNTVNNFFSSIGTDKSLNPDYDTPPDRVDIPKTHTPLLSTFRPISNSSKPKPSATESVDTNNRNQLSSSYDFIRESRRCVLKLDPNKGLGFILSAMGDYDHTVTAIDKGSIADVAGLQVNDELVEIDGINVRNIKYERVIDMLIQAMQTKESIEIHVFNSQNVSNGNNNTNNNNNNSSAPSMLATPVFADKSSNKNTQTGLSKRLACNASHPDLYQPPAYLHKSMSFARCDSVPGISTGLTASPNDFRLRNPIPISLEKQTFYSILETSNKDAPVARLCRVQKFPSSPFYGFFLCSDRKRPGRVFVSNIKKHSSAAICGLRDGDHIIEVNGTNTQNLTYETTLNIIKMHMDHEDLELLVLDKKSLHWYEKRNFPITSQTLSTIVRIEPIINDLNTKF